MRNITAAIAAATTAIVVTGSIAIAAIPDSATKVITGCYSKTSGALVIIDKQAGRSCTTSQIELSWAQQGVPGIPGAAGVAGWAFTTTFLAVDKQPDALMALRL